jgi:putative transposase
MVKNHKLAKSISDAAWNQFAEGLQYFGKIYGKTVIAIGPQYTSQDCSSCGNLVKKTLSTRTHICGCGAILDRDHNAAKNILAKGLKQSGITSNTVGHTEIHAWGQTDLYYEGGSINEQIDWPKQESSRVHAAGVSMLESCQASRKLLNKLLYPSKSIASWANSAFATLWVFCTHAGAVISRLLRHR